MKVSKEYQSEINKAFQALINKHGLELLHNHIRDNIATDNRVKDLDTRIVWDFIRAAYRVMNQDYYNDLVSKLYKVNCHDTHITTALKSEAKKLNII